MSAEHPLRASDLSNRAITIAIELGGSVTHAARLLKTNRGTLSSVIARRGGQERVAELAAQEEAAGVASGATELEDIPAVTAEDIAALQDSIKQCSDEQRAVWRQEWLESVGREGYDSLIDRAIDPADVVQYGPARMTAKGTVTFGFVRRKTIQNTKSTPLKKKGTVEEVDSSRPAQGADATPVEVADLPGWVHTETPVLHEQGKAERALLLSDLHGTARDEAMALLLCAALPVIKPSKAIVAGDIVDNGSFMRGASVHTAGLNENTVAARRHLLELQAAGGEEMEIIALLGNHDDDRIHSHLRTKSPELEGVVPAWAQDQPALSIPFLVGFQQGGLNVEAVLPQKGRPHHTARIILGDLLIKHGTTSDKMPGAAVYRELVNGMTMNVAIGHTHTHALVHRTVFDPITEMPRTLYGIEIGMTADTMAREFDYVDQDKRNWQNGGWTIDVDEDGKTWPEPIRFDPFSKTLRWRSHSWEITAEGGIKHVERQA